MGPLFSSQISFQAFQIHSLAFLRTMSFEIKKLSLAHFSGLKKRRQTEASFSDRWRLKDCLPEMKLFKVLHCDTFAMGRFDFPKHMSRTDIPFIIYSIQ